MKVKHIDTPVIDWKGISSFLVITFGITYAIEGILILSGNSPLVKGLGQYTVALVMWVPALATILTIKFVTREGFGLTNLHFGGWRPYLTVGLVIPACFVLIYGLTWMLGLGQPDWTLQYFKNMFVTAGIETLRIPSPWVIWPALFLVSLLVGPFVNSVFAFGEELGWRGYLLPKLLPLGKPRAYLLTGIVWGLWHLPLVLVGFMYPGYPFSGMLLFTMLTTVLGIYMNELTLRHHSSILAGWIHGVINTQRLGVWALLFPETNPLLGGFSGIVGIGIWLVLGIRESRRRIQ
jgi:membrane protease YdiL (CAAX protease family)